MASDIIVPRKIPHRGMSLLIREGCENRCGSTSILLRDDEAGGMGLGWKKQIGCHNCSEFLLSLEG
jgi:hypothetical protein